MSKFDIGSILGKITKDGIEGLGNSIDGLVTSQEEKLELRKQIFEIYTNSVNKIQEVSASIILAEANGNQLQRNWRPIMALSFGGIVVTTYFFFPVINLYFKSEGLTDLIHELKDNDNFWTLLQLMIGGYTVGRSLEKITEKASDILKDTRKKEKN